MNTAFDYVSSFEEYEFQQLKKHLKRDRLERRCFLSGHALNLQARQTAGFKVNRYLSGEMTGAMFVSGLQSKVVPPSRSGAVETFGFTQPARNKIRRAVENSQLDLKYFLTLTFAPSAAQPWHLDENGNIRHDYAKYRLSRLFDALQIHCKRKFNEALLYVWVAELQKNGNIHFHVLLNRRLPLEYYRRLWNIGNIDVQYISDSNHAVNYMRKYMTKTDNALIKGNRYGIASGLRETMKPIENIICCADSNDLQDGNKDHVEVLDLIKAMKDEIETGGGIVLDFGFSIPAPRRSREYIDKKTKQKKKSKGVHKKLAGNLYQLITEHDFDSCPF